jgi:uncharacterized protein
MTNLWKVIELAKTVPRLKNPVLIEGLPGIGNVGKIAIDFMIEELKAKRLYSLFSHTFPHSVFVNEENLVELPSIELWYAQTGKHDLLILTGDVQPVDEESSYSFSETVLDIAEKFGVSEIVTTGGIGLQEIPEEPKVFITGNDKSFVEKYKDVETKIHGVVGPIVGVSGLLVGLGGMKKVPGVALLAETFGHPMYLGVKGAKEILHVLNKRFGLKLDLKKMTEEIERLEKETIKKTAELRAVKQKMKSGGNDTSYIG